MVQDRSPRFMVGWKCQGASRWVPLWVDNCTCSTAQPCPSGRSSALRPSKNCSMRGSPCWWSIYWMVGCPPGGSAGTSFCNGTEMSINRLAIIVPPKASVIFIGAASDVLALDPVFQDSDLFDLEFDSIAVLKIPSKFEPAAVADGA